MKTQSLALIAGLAVMASGASATVIATYVDTNPGNWGNVSIDSGVTFTGSVKAGQFNWVKTGGTFGGLANGAFATFCIEVQQGILPGNSYTFNIDTVANAPQPMNNPLSAPMGAFKADRISELYGRFFGLLSTNDQYAAFQLAIWDIIYDLGTGVTNGIFQAANFGAAIPLADNWLAQLDGTGPRFAGLYALVSDDHQDQIVPTPGSLALLGLGGLIAARRRRA